MLRASPCFLAVAALAALAPLACNDFLAKNNPCGGIYAVDGTASVGSVQTSGVATLTKQGDASTDDTTYPFDVVDRNDDGRIHRVRVTKHFVSLAFEKYETFDDEAFRDTLNDWGWFGAEQARPDWFTGNPWG